LLVDFFIDLFVFVIHLYWKDLEYSKTKTSPHVVVRTYEKLEEFLSDPKHPPVMGYKQVASEIREVLNVKEGL